MNHVSDISVKIYVIEPQRYKTNGKQVLFVKKNIIPKKHHGSYIYIIGVPFCLNELSHNP